MILLGTGLVILLGSGPAAAQAATAPGGGSKVDGPGTPGTIGSASSPDSRIAIRVGDYVDAANHSQTASPAEPMVIALLRARRGRHPMTIGSLRPSLVCFDRDQSY
jgi:hypothetical protein